MHSTSRFPEVETELRKVASPVIQVMWLWFLTQPPESFHDQSGMAMTFGLIPLTIILWIVGGPVALAFGQRGFDRARPDKVWDQRLALAGIRLGRLMLWSGVIAPFLLFWQVDW